MKEEFIRKFGSECNGEDDLGRICLDCGEIFGNHSGSRCPDKDNDGEYIADGEVVDNHAEMVKAIKAQTAAFEQSQIIEQERHEEVMDNKRTAKEESVWLAACTAYMSSGLMASTSGALESADKVLEAFNKKFYS